MSVPLSSLLSVIQNDPVPVMPIKVMFVWVALPSLGITVIHVDMEISNLPLFSVIT